MKKEVFSLFSVTNRIKNISQPRLGYLPIKKLQKMNFFDKYTINEVDSAYKSIQGMAVDYLTRFMNGESKNAAFQISLQGAAKVDDLNHAYKLLNNINGLDTVSIYNACQLVGYDVALRKGTDYYTSVDKIIPTEGLIQNIIIMVNRSLAFWKEVGPVVLNGFTFEGGYNDIISNGDGDYLTNDTLWDFKVSKSAPTIDQTLQLLVYYILGIHSIHQEFKSIKKLGIFNPELNTAYTVSISGIPDETFYKVSKDVIGYCMPDKIDLWRSATGTSEQAIQELKDHLYYIHKDTGFSPEQYADGIYDITVDDYWSYYRELSKNYNDKPKFKNTQSVKFIKNSGYFMFVSVSEKGITCILQGGRRKKLSQPLLYYYEKLPEYANAVLSRFSIYWDALYSISKQIQSIVPKEKEIKKSYKNYVSTQKKQNELYFDYETWKVITPPLSFSGKVHGCIIDIDFLNHIYVNPYDGKITPYFASSKDMKYVYPNIASLIAANRPEMLSAFNRTIKENSNKNSAALMLSKSKESKLFSIFSKQEIDLQNIQVTDTNMYKISNRLLLLQMVYDHHFICVWYDDIFPDYGLERKNMYNYSLEGGETRIMNCGMPARIVTDNGDNQVTIQFEDGTIVENCHRDEFYKGEKNLSTKQQLKVARKQATLKSYVGKSAIMNCGLKATVIQDFGCNNITVQFEDGLVKKHCRRDKFREGKIGHKV